MAEMNVFCANPCFVWNEATEPEPQELLDHIRKYRNLPAIESIRCPVYVIRKVRLGNHFLTLSRVWPTALLDGVPSGQRKPADKECLQPLHLFFAAKFNEFRGH